MLRNLMQIVCGATLIVAGAAMPAFGQSFTFNFNSLTGYSSTSGNQESSIASQLQSQLQTVCPSCTIIATTGTGAVIDKTYTGEGHAVGPTSGFNVKSETLGDTPANANFSSGNSTYSYSQLTGFTNQFLSNTNDSSGQKSQEISFQFSGLTITGASFNYEIFPDGSAQQPPDFTFQAGTNTNGSDTTVLSTIGVTPSSPGTDGSNTHSPNSGVFGSEASAQYIGTWSGTFAGSTELDFIDWPATIAIDNLKITYNTPSSVPEPGSIFLFGTVAAGILLVWRRKIRTA